LIPQYACVPGATLLPDFFLDEFDDHVAAGKGAKKPAAASASVGGGGKVDQIFDRIGKHLSAELVGQAQAVYLFKVTGVAANAGSA
jgi:hypothetical protein